MVNNEAINILNKNRAIFLIKRNKFHKIDLTHIYKENQIDLTTIYNLYKIFDNYI